MPSSIVDKLVEDSKETINWILSTDNANNVDHLLSLANGISYNYKVPAFPYYADENFKYNSLFLETWVKRLIRRQFLDVTSLRLTKHAKKHLKFRNPIGQNPITDIANLIRPFSILPPNTMDFPKRTVRIRPQLDEVGLILIGLLPPDPAYFLIFSHYDAGAMRTTYPLIKDGDDYLTLYMGDIRNIVLVPQTTILDSCYSSYCNYLGRNIQNFKRYIEVIVYLLASISTIQFTHSCQYQTVLLNKQQNTLDKMLDFVPECQCGLQASRHTNIIEMRHSLGRAWEKGVLSELFFSKLVVDATHRIDPTIEVFPRLTLDGVPHECDVFVKKNNNIILFELKRSTNFDGYCQQGVTQLNDNKTALESFGVKCKTVLVTNMLTTGLPKGTNVDVHLIASDILTFGTKFQNLLF